MGACDFSVRVKRADSPTMSHAFMRATSEAHREHGHSGYSGTIGTKGLCKPVPEYKLDMKIATWAEAEKEAARLMRHNHEIYDKWGLCWAIEVPGLDGGWLFFGVAPS